MKKKGSRTPVVTNIHHHLGQVPLFLLAGIPETVELPVRTVERRSSAERQSSFERLQLLLREYNDRYAAGREARRERT